MDPGVIAIAARSFERIVAVVLGGMAIYYGYRLFLALPVETRGDGRIHLPGMSVVLAKAGPGLFFAAFGAIIAATSLIQKVSVDGHNTYEGVTAPAARTSRQVQPADMVDPQELARVGLEVQTLNCMQRWVDSASTPVNRGDWEITVRDAKLALLKGVWNGPVWGDYEAFKQWAAGGAPGTASPARAVFEAHKPGCGR
jgi:hypothetical protein